jgi:hypothetical protein
VEGVGATEPASRTGDDGDPPVQRTHCAAR